MSTLGLILVVLLIIVLFGGGLGYRGGYGDSPSFEDILKRPEKRR